MKFGFHTQMVNWQHELPHSQVLDNVREQVLLCEELGFDAVWLPEHHMNPEGFGNSPNPILFAADLASRTSRITFGFACLTATLWHPIRLAEDVALLDQMTKGRVEVGFGRGGRPGENMAFNVVADPRDESKNRDLFIETIDAVIEAWTNDFFSHEGQHYTLPPKDIPHHPWHVSEEPYVEEGQVTKFKVVPKTYQKPHPPIWLMVTSERTARLTAERGYNAMAAGTSIKALSDHVDIYTGVRSELEHRRITRGEGWAASRPVHVAPTMEEACRNFEIPVIRQREFQQVNSQLRNTSQTYLENTKKRSGDTPESTAPAKITWESLREHQMLAGSPEDVVEQIHQLRDVCGIEYVSTFMDAGGVPHDKIMQSIELFGTKVMPRFR